MTKKLFIITLLLLIFSWGLYRVADNFDTFFDLEDTSIVASGSTEPEIELTQREINQQIVQEKIAKLKARYAQKGLILAGDDHLKNNEYLDAITLYSSALKKSPNDEQLIEKIADTYFAMKRYSLSYKRYKQLLDYQGFDIHKLWLAFIYHTPYTSEKKQVFLDEIDGLNTNDENNFYYKTLVGCLDDFHQCKKDLGEYLDIHPDTSSSGFLALSGAIANYEAFQVDQIYYKDTLILKALYDDKNYPFVILLAEDILVDQPGYRPVIKMVAQSYFEIGNYEQAKNYLNQVYELDKEDTSIMYMLGVVNMQLEDYVLSNIFFNKALESGYTPSIYIRRFLANNYIDLEKPEKALEIFSDIYTLESDGVTKDDLILAVYYNILYNNIVTAKAMVEHSLNIFPEEADFYGFAGWIERQDSNLVGAMEYLTQGHDINSENSMITLNIAQVAIAERNKSQATTYLNQTIKNDPDGQFGSIAQELLEGL